MSPTPSGSQSGGRGTVEPSDSSIGNVLGWLGLVPCRKQKRRGFLHRRSSNLPSLSFPALSKPFRSSALQSYRDGVLFFGPLELPPAAQTVLFPLPPLVTEIGRNPEGQVPGNYRSERGGPSRAIRRREVEIRRLTPEPVVLGHPGRQPARHLERLPGRADAEGNLINEAWAAGLEMQGEIWAEEFGSASGWVSNAECRPAPRRGASSFFSDYRIPRTAWTAKAARSSEGGCQVALAYGAPRGQI
jgi:hypothetical protein